MLDTKLHCSNVVAGKEADMDQPKDKSVYFAKYYKENRPAILAKRRLRYQHDPEYKARMQEKARERARKKAAERRAARAEENRKKALGLKKKPLDLDLLGPQKVKRWPVGDFVTASVVATALNVSLGTLGNWIRGGVVPPPTVSSTAGKHLFSLAYLNLVRDCRIEALAQGMVNGEFKHLVNERYETIRDTEERLRKGETID
jgi:DNA-binding transcriptional regulator YiaG